MPLPTIDDLLMRADESALQQLIGASGMRLFRAIRPEVSFSELRTALKSIRPERELLEDDADRRLVLELMSPQELEAVAQNLGIRNANVSEVVAATQPRSGSFERLAESLCVSPGRIITDEPVRLQREACVPGKGLFAHQREAALKARAAMERYPHRVLLHMPTGAGKTRTAMHIVADHLRQRRSATVYWLATSEELCEQAVSEFRAIWSHAGSHAVEVVRAWGRHSASREALCAGVSKVVVAGLSKLYSATARDPALLAYLAVGATLVVFDEAHQAIAPTYRAVVDGLLARNQEVQLLGLTATPGRSWNDPAADALLARYFNESKITLSIPGYDSPINYLIDEGYLARPNFTRLISSAGVSLTQSEIDNIAIALDVPESVRHRLAASDVRNIQIVRCCERLLRSHKRVLLFGATVAHSDILAAVLKMNGHQAHSISGATPSAERARLVNWYLSTDDSPKILCNYGVLTTGFDAPKTSAVVIARPTTSLVLYSQMVGRGLRGLQAGGNREAEIVTVIDPSIPGFGDVADAFANWEDVWRETGDHNES